MTSWRFHDNWNDRIKQNKDADRRWSFDSVRGSERGRIWLWWQWLRSMPSCVPAYCQRIESGGNNWKGGRYNKECVFDFQTQQVVELTLCCPAGRRYSSYIILITLFLDVSAMAPTWFTDVSYMVHIWLLDGSRIFPICSCMLPTGFPLCCPSSSHSTFPTCVLHVSYVFPTWFLYVS